MRSRIKSENRKVIAYQVDGVRIFADFREAARHYGIRPSQIPMYIRTGIEVCGVTLDWYEE